LLADALVGCGSEDAATATEHPSRLRVRLAVSDARTGTLSFFDIADNEIVGRLNFAKPVARMAAAASGDTAIVSTEPGSAAVVSGGTSVIPHKGHIHILKSPAEVLGAPMTGIGEVSAVFAHGRWGIHFAGALARDGQPSTAAQLASFSEEQWFFGNRTPVALGTAPPHEGFVIPTRDGFLASRATGDARIVGLDGVDAGGGRTALVDCAATARASNDDWVIAGCGDASIVWARAGAPLGETMQRKPSPAGNLKALEARAGLAYAVGHAESGQVVAIAMDTGAVLGPLALGNAPVCEVHLEIATKPRLIALQASGELLRWDLVTGTSLGTTRATDAFACDAAERPHFTASPGRAWVTDPRSGKVFELDTDKRIQTREVPIGGAPLLIVAMGLDARNADLTVGNDKLSD
jgi:hypothetical protein